MFVTRLSISTIAAALLAASAAQAADYSQPLPPPVYQPPPVVVQSPMESWYLRGFVGVGMNAAYKLDYLPAPANAGNGFHFESNSISDTFFIGGGIGYEWNNWLRFDATAEYRAKSRVYAFGSYPAGGGAVGIDTYEGYIKSWLFLANAYVDLGTWNCFTPFVGAGIGGAYNTMYNLTDINLNTGRGFGRNSSEWHMAWALYAGVAYEVSKNLKVELAYRYLNYGSITDTVDCVGGCNADQFKFGNLYSHDIMLGLRWTCCEVPPLPVYMPPLRSRG